MKRKMAMNESMPITTLGFPGNQTSRFGRVPGARVFRLRPSNSRKT